MANDKQKISVNISRGMREDVDPFTLEPPHSEYLENARLDKDACIAKRRGDTQLGELGTLSGDPKIFADLGNTLITISDDAIHRYSGETDSWSNTDLAHPLYGTERKASTAAARGAGLFNMAVTPNGYVVTYEIRKGGDSNGDPNPQCVVEGYGKDGELLWRDQFFGINPEVHQTYALGILRYRVIVMYTAYGQGPDYNGSPISLPRGATYTKIYNTQTGATVGSTDIKEGDTAIYNPYCVAGLYNNPIGFVITSATIGKMGETINCWQSAQTRLSMNETQEKGIVAYFRATTDHVTADVGWIEEIDRDGINTGFNWNFETGSSNHAYLLDAKLDDSGYAHVLWTTRVPSSAYDGQTTLKYAVRNLSTGTTLTQTIYSTGDFMVSQGSIGVRNIFEPAYISYRMDLGTIVTPDTPDTKPMFDESYLEIREVTSWIGSITLSTAAKIRNHGLASGIAIQESSNKAYQCIEQYNDFTPAIDPGNTDVGEADTPASVKQVTTILCEITANQDQPVIPVATLDAGTAKHMDAARSMQCNHLNTLYVDALDGYSLYYVNRNLYAPEDHSLEVSGVWAGTATLLIGHSNFALAGGSARGNVYRIADDYGFVSTTFGDGLMVNSALPLWIDEGTVAEAALLDQPEITNVVCSKAVDAPVKWGYNELSTGDWWNFQAIVSYTDHAGNVHRSSPSEVLYLAGVDETDLGSATTDGELTFKVTPPVALNPNQPYTCDIYSGQSGENLRLCASKTFLPSDVYEDGIEVSWQHILYRNTNSENILRSTKDVYTTGGEFAADPWAPFGASVVTSTRMFALSTSLIGTVFYTKRFAESVSPEFSASNVLSLGDARKLKAIGTIDDKVLVFEKDAVHVIYGEGPSNTGRGTPFSVQRLQTDIGCEDPESVVEIPQGLMFYSSVSSEFHLIDRELQLHSIGASVRGMSESIDIKAATVVPEEREVRFTVTDTSSSEAWGPEPDPSTGSIERPPRPRFRHVLPAQPVIVYNYERDAWWVNRNMRAEATTLFQNKFTRIDSTFNVFQESSDSWQSQTGDSLMRVTTPWFKFDGLQGYARVRRAWILGRYMSDFSDSSGIQAGDLQVTARYNNEGKNGSTTTKLYRANVELQPDAERLQLRFTPGRQKVQSIQFDINELKSQPVNVDDPAFSIGRGFEISGIDLEVVLKGGGIKTLSARRKK